MNPHALARFSDAHAAAVLDAADRTGALVDRLVRSTWDKILAAIQPGALYPAVYHAVRLAVVPLAAQLVGQVGDQLVAVGLHAAERTAAAVEEHVTPKTEAAGDRRRVTIFERPSAEDARRRVFDSDWHRRMQRLTRLANPETLAHTIAIGVQQAKSPATIARQILPVVQNVRSSAKRVARTEAMKVAHSFEMDTYDQLGDLVVGFQINATKDINTRKAHYDRDGDQFFKDPKPGQLGLDAMPRPPLEADGSVAHNCRCYLTPILDQNPPRFELPVSDDRPDDDTHAGRSDGLADLLRRHGII
jgi:hypothetical protein